MRPLALIAAILAGCSAEPVTAPDASEAVITAASRAAVSDTDAARRDAAMASQGIDQR